MEIPKTLRNNKDLSSIVAHLHELLLIYDYSSIAIDFALIDRTILIYAYNFEAYENNFNSVYFGLEQILSKPFISNEDGFLE